MTQGFSSDIHVQLKGKAISIQVGQTPLGF